MKKGVKITKVASLTFLAILFSTVIIFTFYELNFREKISKKNLKEFEELYTDFQKEKVKEDVEIVAQLINLELENHYVKLDFYLKEKIELIGQYIVENYSTYSKKELFEILEKKLKYQEFFNGLGYYFVEDFNGEYLINKSIDDMDEIEYRQISQKSIAILDYLQNFDKEKKSGFIEYFWVKPGQKGEFKKRSYVKTIDSLGIVIGTGYYIDEERALVKRRILDILDGLRFGANNERYLYAIDYNGIMVMHPIDKYLENRDITKIKSENGRFIHDYHKEILKSSKKEGFANYNYKNPSTNIVEEKIVYIKGIDRLGMTIASGVYLSELREVIEKNKEEFKGEFLLVTSNIIIISIIFILLFLLAFCIINIYLEQDLLRVIDFLKKAHKKKNYLDIKKLRFLEVRKIAIYANLMYDNNNQMKEKLEVLVNTDELTKLPNRRYLFNYLENLVLKGKPYIIAILDIDYFKKINDTYGHLVGDEVLVALANLLISKDSRYLISRLGGEEFALIMPLVSQMEIKEYFESLRKKIEETIMVKDKNIKITVSIGFAHSNEELNCDEVFKLADDRLYIAKENGRNRVEGSLERK